MIEQTTIRETAEYSEIGRIIADPGIYDEDGSEITAPSYLDGWHVNMTALLPGMVAYQVFPENPRRVYAGVETVFLRFADEAEWLKASNEPIV